jgi:hypothetical protein
MNPEQIKDLQRNAGLRPLPSPLKPYLNLGSNFFEDVVLYGRFDFQCHSDCESEI